MATEKRLPADYIWIKKWHESYGSQHYYWQALQEKAVRAEAPLNAIYYKDDADGWRTIDDITSNATRGRLGLPLRSDAEKETK